MSKPNGESLITKTTTWVIFTDKMLFYMNSPVHSKSLVGKEKSEVAANYLPAHIFSGS